MIQLYSKREIFLKLQSTSRTERKVEVLHKSLNMITECCFANAIKMYIAHFRLLKLCGVFIASPVRAVVRSNFLIVSISLCWFCSDVQCISGKCRAYPGNRSLCAGDRVEAVTALDILYNDFHQRVYGLLNSSGEERSCGMNYTCPDGEHLCQTRYEMLRHVDLKKYVAFVSAFPAYHTLQSIHSRFPCCSSYWFQN